MKLNYYPETDSLYIDLSENDSAESREVAEGVVLDYDAFGNLVGIDIDHASGKVQLEQLTLRGLTLMKTTHAFSVFRERPEICLPLPQRKGNGFRCVSR